MEQLMEPNGTTPEQNQNQSAPAALDADAIRQEVLKEVFNGKFQSIEDAKAGYWNLNNYASQAYQMLNERANPAQQAQHRQPDPFEQLESEALVKRDVLRQAIRAEAGQLLNESLAPLAQAWQSRQELTLTMPEYVRNEPEIMSWLQKNQPVAQKVARLNHAQMYDLAAETALNAWRAANPPANSGNAEARAQATLPNTQSLPGNRTMTPEQQSDAFQKALEYKRLTGDHKPAYAQVFSGFKVQLPPHLADQIAQR